MTMTRKQKIAICASISALFIIAGSVLIASFRKLSSTEIGLEYDVHKKQLDDAAKAGGLHIGPPGYRFVKFPSTFITVDQEGTCVSKDGLRVGFQTTFQYQLPEDNIVPVVRKYRDFDKWADAVESAALSATHHACAEFIISDYQNKRGAIQTRMEEKLRIKLGGKAEQPADKQNNTDDNGDGDGDGGSVATQSALPPEDSELFGVYARAISLQLRNVDVPRQYKDAVSEKQAAEEDIELAQTQRRQEVTKANTTLLAAREEIRRIRDTAANEAALLLEEARLRAEETTFAFAQEAETIVRVKNDLNLTTDGVLAYLHTKLLERVGNLRVTSGEPARLSRKDEL